MPLDVQIKKCALAAMLLFPVMNAAAQEGGSQIPGPYRRVLRGRVLDHERQPAAQAKVYAVTSAGGRITYRNPDSVNIGGSSADRAFLFFRRTRNLSSAEAVCDDAGDFVFKRLKAGTFDLLAVHPERGIQLVRGIVQPNFDHPVEIVLEPPTFVQGCLKHAPDGTLALHCDGDLPWEQQEEEAASSTESKSASVSIAPQADVDEEGQFRFGPLPAGGQWTLELSQSVRRRRFAATLFSTPLTMKAGETARLEYDFSRGSICSGTVSGPEDEHLDDVAVELCTGPEESAVCLGALTDDKGTYTIGGLESGSYRLRAYRHIIPFGPG